MLLLLVQDVLSAGQGYLNRVAESGQLVLNRVQHADVLEYLWYLTRWGASSKPCGQAGSWLSSTLRTC
jgi:hypothetical protein